MKKLIYILLVLTLSSCTGSKSIFNKETITNEKEKTSIAKDSSNVIATNGAIKDRIIVNVPETNNAEVMAMLEAVLVQLNTSKTSGSNSYKSTYDKDTRQFIIDFMVAQTKNQTTATNSDILTEKTFEETVSENSKKVIKMIPLWFWIALGVWFLPQILTRVQMLVNPVLGFINVVSRKTNN